MTLATDPYRNLYATAFEREAAQMMRDTHQAAELAIYRDAMASAAKSLIPDARAILRDMRLAADMPAKLLMDQVAMQQRDQLQQMAQWLVGGETTLAEAMKHLGQPVGGQTAAQVLKEIQARENKRFAEGLSGYTERMQTELESAKSAIESIYGGKAIKDILEKYAQPLKRDDSADVDTHDEPTDAREETPESSASEAETLRLAIQSLGETAKALHELATSPESKNLAQRANIIAMRSLVIGCIALLATILATVMTPFWDVYVKECLLRGDPKCTAYSESIGSEKQTIKDDAAFDLYRAMRRITARDVTLRMNAKGLSPAVTHLGAGELVVVLREERDWTLIEADVKGSKRAGWVYTRYLTKI